MSTIGALTDIGIAAAAIGAIIAAGYAIAKLPPLRWVWRNLVVRGWCAVVAMPLSKWLVGVIRPVVVEVIEPIEKATEARLDAAEAVGERIEHKVDALSEKADEIHTDVVKNGNGATPPQGPSR